MDKSLKIYADQYGAYILVDGKKVPIKSTSCIFLDTEGNYKKKNKVQLAK